MITGLNIKDYPFAFSISALFFPNVLGGSSSQDSLIGVLLIGGIIGSLLTITNPVGRIIIEKYKRSNLERIDYILFPDLFIKSHKLTQRIIQKNFKESLTSPAISVENDKIVGMLYFIIILGSTIIRSVMPDFTDLLKLDQTALWSIRGVAIIGLIGVTMVLLNHAYGINFRRTPMQLGRAILTKLPQQTGLSQFDRICCITVSNLALDFSNLSNEGTKWKKHGTQDDILRPRVLREFLKINKRIEEKMSPKITTSFADFQTKIIESGMEKLYVTRNFGWGEVVLEDLFQKYRIAKDISLKYDVDFDATLTWFSNLIFFDSNELYQLEQLLKGSIESRDWYSAYLMMYRITDRIEYVLRQKNMPNMILNE